MATKKSKTDTEATEVTEVVEAVPAVADEPSVAPTPEQEAPKVAPKAEKTPVSVAPSLDEVRVNLEQFLIHIEHPMQGINFVVGVLTSAVGLYPRSIGEWQAAYNKYIKGETQ